MNIIEAAKTGKRIRRKAWADLVGWYTFAHGGLISLSREDTLADDWEVEETPITLTRAQFEAAYMRTPSLGRFMHDLAKELGFGGDE